MKHASKCGAFYFNYSCSSSNYICDEGCSVSYIPKGERDSANYPVSWEGSDSGSDWYAGRLLSEKYDDSSGTTWNSRGNCCGGDGFTACVEKKYFNKYYLINSSASVSTPFARDDKPNNFYRAYITLNSSAGNDYIFVYTYFFQSFFHFL